jgi:hypothetical protein
LQVSQRFVVIGLGPDFGVPRIRQSVLALEKKKRRRTPNGIKALFAGELKLRVLASRPRGQHPSPRRFDTLRRISNFDDDNLLL